MLYESQILKENPKAEYLEDIKLVLKNVKSIYFNWYMHKPATDRTISEEIEKKHEEKVFAYELYHQIRKIMEENPVPDRYKNVYLNGEAIKDDKFFTDLYEGLSIFYKSFKDDKNNKRIPDLVLHKDQGSINKEGQIYLAEIKMGDNKKALDDLEKLTALKNGKLAFEFYIFIYVGKDVNEFKEELKQIDTSNYSKDIVCICTKYQQSTCNTLGELLEVLE